MCKICGRINECHPRCPNYVPAKPLHYCSICNQEIQIGEEYIVNDNGQYSHWNCVDYGRDLAKFLGYDIRIMEN